MEHSELPGYKHAFELELFGSLAGTEDLMRMTESLCELTGLATTSCLITNSLASSKSNHTLKGRRRC